MNKITLSNNFNNIKPFCFGIFKHRIKIIMRYEKECSNIIKTDHVQTFHHIPKRKEQNGNRCYPASRLCQLNLASNRAYF